MSKNCMVGWRILYILGYTKLSCLFSYEKRDAFAMIRQLGFPSIFITQSAAERKWKDLLKCLGKTVHNKEYTSEEIDAMDYKTKCKLIQGYSLDGFFENNFNMFMKDVVKSKCKPIGEVPDYFWWKEIAARGAIHVHWLAYINDALVYGESSNEYVADYYDKIISCSSDVPEEYKEYINYQIHRHSKSCHVGKLKLSTTTNAMYMYIQTVFGWRYWKGKLRKTIMVMYYELGTNVTESFNGMLMQLDMTMDQYINGFCSSISHPKFFPKRNPCEIKINNYMCNCLHIWRANCDIQLSLSPPAMIKYILSYVTKGQKGMSIMIKCACEDATHGSMGLKESVYHMGNVFLNGVETSQEEAAFLLLQLPMIYMTRGTTFINTSPPHKRTFLVKNGRSEKKMDSHSTEIQTNNLTFSMLHMTIVVISRLVKKVPSLELLPATKFGMRLVW